MFTTIFLFCCATSKEFTARADNLFSDDEYEAGLAAMNKSDCRTCHMLSERNVGPAFKQIADRYEKVSESVVEKLSKKIITGGSRGSWGKIPMAPHPSLSDDEAKAIVKYILLTKYK